MCRSGCPTPGQHKTWGECARAAHLRIAYCGIGGGDATRQRAWDQELAAYRAARAQGIQPDSTNRAQIEQAVRASNEAGAAYGRDFHVAPGLEE